MKHLAFVFLIGIGLGSCTEVIFTEPQPGGVADLREIPENWVGSFVFVLLNSEEMVEVTREYFRSDDELNYLSDSLILREKDGRFFLNRRVRSESGTNDMWSVQMIEEKGCGFLKVTGFYIGEDREVDDIVKRYNGEIVSTGDEKRVLISADAQMFRELLADDLSTMSMILEKVEQY